MTTVEDAFRLIEDLVAVLTRIAERLDDEHDRREETFRLPDPPVTP